MSRLCPKRDSDAMSIVKHEARSSKPMGRSGSRLERWASPVDALSKSPRSDDMLFKANNGRVINAVLQEN